MLSTHEPDLTMFNGASSERVAKLLMVLCRPSQLQLLEQEPSSVLLPTNSLIHWVLSSRDAVVEYQHQSLIQLLTWLEDGVLQPPPAVTSEPGWQQLWQAWRAQGVHDGWLLDSQLAVNWSLLKLQSSDAAPLISAVGFSRELPKLAESVWKAAFLLTNGYDFYLLDCAGQRYQAATGKSCCLFDLCLRFPQLYRWLAKEAETFKLKELLFYKLIAPMSESVDSEQNSVGFPRKKSDLLPLSYQEISELALAKPWLLRYLPMDRQMSMYRLPLSRYMPWLYRQLWPAEQSFKLLTEWLCANRLHQPFLKGSFFENALMQAIANGMPMAPHSENYSLTEQMQEVRSALATVDNATEASTDPQYLLLADLPRLTSLWWQQCNITRPSPLKMRADRRRFRSSKDKPSKVELLPPLLEQLKVLFMMLQSLHAPKLRLILAKCPWLALLLPLERQQTYLMDAVDAAPPIAALVLDRLTGTQRLRALQQAPQLLAKLGNKLSAAEYRKLVLLHPQLAIHYQDWATQSHLAQAVAEQPELLGQIASALHTSEFYCELVSLRGDLLADIPLRRRSFKLCHLAIKQRLSALAFVSESFDRQLCQQEQMWPFYQQSYLWAEQYQPDLMGLFEQKLPEFMQMVISDDMG